MAPNKYHCSSSQALELTLNSLRTVALVALTSTASRINQVTARPTRRLMSSITRERASRAFMIWVFGKCNDKTRASPRGRGQARVTHYRKPDGGIRGDVAGLFGSR